MLSVTKEEFELADDDGDGLELKEAFALWMMKTHLCTQKNDSGERQMQKVTTPGMTETGTAVVQIHARILTQTNAHLHTHTASGECTNNETWVDGFGHGCDFYEAAPAACLTAVVDADEVMYYI